MYFQKPHIIQWELTLKKGTLGLQFFKNMAPSKFERGGNSMI